MTRRKTTSTSTVEAPPPSPPPRPHVIKPTAVYSVDEAKTLLKLRASTIRRELREGRLRVSKRAGRYYLLGEWLLEWLRGGELRKRAPGGEHGNGATAAGPGTNGNGRHG